jgi:hypothetical protein
MVPTLHLVPARIQRTFPLYGKILSFINPEDNNDFIIKKHRERSQPVHPVQHTSRNIQPFKGWCLPEQPEGYIKPFRHNLL